MSRRIDLQVEREQASSQFERDMRRAQARRDATARRIRSTSIVVVCLVLLTGGLTGARLIAGPASASPDNSVKAAVAMPQSVPVKRDVTTSAQAAKSIGATTTQATPPPAKTVRAVVLSRKPKAPAPRSQRSPSPQRFRIAIGRVGYEPAAIGAKASSPITLTVGKGEGCAAGFNIPRLGVHADNSSGPVTIKLGRVKPGSYTYTCSMGMVSGRLSVR